MCFLPLESTGLFFKIEALGMLHGELSGVNARSAVISLVLVCSTHRVAFVCGQSYRACKFPLMTVWARWRVRRRAVTPSVQDRGGLFQGVTSCLLPLQHNDLSRSRCTQAKRKAISRSSRLPLPGRCTKPRWTKAAAAHQLQLRPPRDSMRTRACYSPLEHTAEKGPDCFENTKEK